MNMVMIIYGVIVLIAFFASYKYVTYMMNESDINLSTNVFVSSMINLAAFTLIAFSWFIYLGTEGISTFLNGLEMGAWVYLSSEVILIAILLYKYKKEEITTGATVCWDFIRTNSLKAYETMKTVMENLALFIRKRKHNN
ncbi:hypothetical protein NC661_06440 [Aquibacillus koreensis]|uniref:Uncharacterized protein n=1 Tax=Aquibacillus koreensis TaxID=279446 RepID=A0A9X4AHD5_9BACI|nr:hypothetical protein [Aquibacillus koreensis]MCT2535708.1 hypothetical protein [Aquibacillus koreensis]MDC3420007.1 hypothetical protein [Aquibacillus koreensis]